MSQPDLESVSVPSVISKKPRYDVYFVILVIALISLLMACLFLLLEWKSYGFDWGGKIGAITLPLGGQMPNFWV